MKFIVKPARDGHDMRGNWVAKGPKKTTTHVKKSAAIDAARRRAEPGDMLQKHRTNGTIQGPPKEIRKASPSSTDQSSDEPRDDPPFAADAVETGIDEFYR